MTYYCLIDFLALLVLLITNNDAFLKDEKSVNPQMRKYYRRYSASAKPGPVFPDDLLVPEKAVLSDTPHIPQLLVIPVDIDEAVALAEALMGA